MRKNRHIPLPILERRSLAEEDFLYSLADDEEELEMMELILQEKPIKAERSYSFHPLKTTDIQRYFYEMMNKPKLFQQARIAEIAKTEQDREKLEWLYFDLNTNYEKKPESSYEHGLGYTLALIAGFIHPFWGCRQGGLHRLITEKKMEELLPYCHTTYHAGYCGKREFNPYGLISQGFSAGIYIPYEKLASVKAILLAGKHKKVMKSIFSEDRDFDSLLEAFEYAQTYQTGLYEAKDVSEVIEWCCESKEENMRYPGFSEY